MAKLLVQESAGIREFEVVDPEVRMGRELDNALRLADPSISRHHAVLRRTAQGYEVEDLGSSNGVLVNGEKVQSAPVKDGDRVTLGQVQITFSDPAPVAESPLGTVRMSAADMAKVHAGPGTAPVEVPVGMASEPVTPPVAAPAPMPPPMPPPMPSAVVPPPVPMPPPMPPAPAADRFRPLAPSGGSASNPLPDFLQQFFPAIPDEARPTGERGDFFSRLVANLIDGVVMFLCFLPLSILSLIPLLGLVFSLVTMVLSLAAPIGVAWCWITFGATPGKKMMKLRVVPEADPTGRIDVQGAVMRFVGYLINGVLCGLPYLMIFGAERKGLQDILSKSLVIKVDR